MGGLFQALLEQVVIPEITNFFAARAAAGQPPPTDAEVIAHLNNDANAGIATGQAWLDAHTPPTDPTIGG